jgi:hypothetical protein
MGLRRSRTRSSEGNFTMTEISFEGAVLQIGDQQFELDYPIRDVVRRDDLVVVLFDSLTKPLIEEEALDNVVAFSIGGDKVWTIDPPTIEHEDSENTYVGIRSSDGDLIANCWTGDVYTVDPESGAVEYRSFSK